MKAANDNTPKIHRIGLGNEPWRVHDAFGRLNDAETFTASQPLRVLHELVVQAIVMMRTETSAENNCAVYVIGDVHGRECKIGKAVDPVARLAQLQTGNPMALFIHRVFWLRRGDADAVEIQAHRFAGKYHKRLQGEWFECDPSKAHDAVEKAILYVTGIKSACVMTPFDALMEVAA